MKKDIIETQILALGGPEMLAYMKSKEWFDKAVEGDN